eukprot:gene17632-23209_t
MAATGEMVFYIAAQEEESLASNIERWALPSHAAPLIMRQVVEDTDEIVKHYAAKTIENILSQGNRIHKIKFVNINVAMKFLDYSLNSKNEALQITCGLAFSHLVHVLFSDYENLSDDVFSKFENLIPSLNSNSNRRTSTVLPIQTEFAVAYRDRAFSWDVSCEGEIHPDLIPPLIITSNNNIIDSSTGCVLMIPSKAKHFSSESLNLNKIDIPYIIEKKLENEIKIKEEPTIKIKEEPHLRSNQKLNRKITVNEKVHSSVELAYNEDDLFPDLIKTVTKEDLFLLEKKRPDSFDDTLAVFATSICNLDSESINVISNNPVKPSINMSSLSTICQGNIFSSLSKKSYTSMSPTISISQNNQDEVKVGAYTKQERQERIQRFRTKKMNRIWKKQIKYDCRKRLADTRPRVKGRFVSRASPELLNANIQFDDGLTSPEASFNNLSTTSSDGNIGDLTYLSQDSYALNLIMSDNHRKNINLSNYSKQLSSSINSLQPGPFARSHTNDLKSETKEIVQYYVTNQSKKLEVLQVNQSSREVTNNP